MSEEEQEAPEDELTEDEEARIIRRYRDTSISVHLEAGSRTGGWLEFGEGGIGRLHRWDHLLTASWTLVSPGRMGTL